MKNLRVLFLALALVTGQITFAITVTFKVDMAQQTVPPEGVHIAGSFQGWDPGATTMTLESGTIYTYSADFTVGESIEYKFINGDEWGEDESVPSDCNQNNNRFLVVPAENIILDAVCFGACEPCGIPAEVTFRVDMSEQTVAAEGVHVAGNFQGWNPASTELLPIGDNIYATTITVSENQYLEFKYINGNDWPGEEVVPEACGVPDGVAGYNRFYTVPIGGGTMEAICFASCEPCDFVPTEVDVTFSVDMSEESISANGVHIVGEFQGWDPTANPMTDMGDDLYQATFTLYAGDHHQYKFINGNTWDDEEIVPEECGEDNGQGGFNRFVDVTEENIELDTVCYSSCSPCDYVPIEAEVTFLVDMTQETVSPNGVHIVGEFQGWDPAANAMTDMGDNLYKATFTFYAGDHHQYKFINGDTWDDEEIVPQECGEDNGQGGYNRFVNVPDENIILDTVCYGSCSPCGYDPVEVFVTFKVDMSLETVSSEGVFLVSDFQGWEPGVNPMNVNEQGVYEATFLLYSNDHHQYKFINGNTWDDEEIVPAECGEDNGQGGFNRFINVPEESLDLDIVCFSSCEPCTVGIEYQSSNSTKFFKVSPNPFTEGLNIQSSGDVTIDVKFEMVNVFGQKVFEVDINEMQSNYVINQLELEKGVYFCRVEYLRNNQSVTEIIKVVKK